MRNTLLCITFLVMVYFILVGIYHLSVTSPEWMDFVIGAPRGQW